MSDLARDNASSNVPDTSITINLNLPATTTNDGQQQPQGVAVAANAPPEEMNHSTGSQRSLNSSRIFPFRLSRDMILQNVSQLLDDDSLHVL
jgi:hypothetical protein